MGFLALSVALAIVLVAALTAWRHERSTLHARIADLTQQAERAQVVWKAQLAACHAATPTRQVAQAAEAEGGDDAARRLLARGPEGIDGCARMESADQAVLATLK
jgi:hypothetical protein